MADPAGEWAGRCIGRVAACFCCCCYCCYLDDAFPPGGSTPEPYSGVLENEAPMANVHDKTIETRRCLDCLDYSSAESSLANMKSLLMLRPPVEAPPPTPGTLSTRCPLAAGY